MVDPMDQVVCRSCMNGGQEDVLLLCEDCDYARHTYCCNPPLLAVPKGIVASFSCYFQLFF